MDINPGDIVRIRTDPPFSDVNGAPADPGTVRLHIRREQDDEQIFAYPGAVQKVSTGNYRYDFPVELPGTYFFWWEGDDGLTTQEGSSFTSVAIAGSSVTSFDKTIVTAGAYLTPARFKTMRTGASFKNLSDAEIADVLSTASEVADAYCNVPLFPKPATFLGGTVVGEEHRWLLPMSPLQHDVQRRVYPYRWPIREVTGFRIVIGADLGADIPASYLVVNNAERWVEVSSFATSGIISPFGLMNFIVPSGIQHPVVLLDYSYGWSIPEVDGLYDVDGGGRVWQASHGYWDTSVPPVVTVDGVIEATGWTVAAEDGRIRFADSQAGKLVRVAYNHRLPGAIPRATALIAADLLGDAKLRQAGFVGVDRLTVNEVTIHRTKREGSITDQLEEAVPEAAAMLSGFRYFRAA